MHQVNKRRKIVDSTDREILRFMYNARRNLTGNQIAKKIGMSPPAIKPRLVGLQRRGIVKPFEIGKPRKIGIRKTRMITAPSRIFWGLDMQTKKSKKLKR